MSLALATRSDRFPELRPPDDVPKDLTIYEALEGLRHYECQQNEKELDGVLEILRGRKSLLEIGSNFGGTLWRMAKVLAPQSRVVCLDLPEPKHVLLNPVHSLKFNCQRVANMGHDTTLIIGDSHNPMNRKLVEEKAPYDFIFIDGDHSYEGVKQDWEDYGHMGKIVAFHDIKGATDGCVRFWSELRASTKYGLREFDFPTKHEEFGQLMRLGIGIVFRE